MKPNNETTANKLYGNPILEWETDLSTLRDISQKSKHATQITKNATFQQRILNEDYQVSSPQFPFNATNSPKKVVVPPMAVGVPKPSKKVTIAASPKSPKQSTISISPKIAHVTNKCGPVILPKFSTKVEIESQKIKHPVTTSEKEISMSLRSMKNISTVLENIDLEKMIPGRVGSFKAGYSLNDLKTFASDLGIPISGKSKKDLIDAITNLRKERGLNS